MQSQAATDVAVSKFPHGAQSESEIAFAFSLQANGTDPMSRPEDMKNATSGYKQRVGEAGYHAYVAQTDVALCKLLLSENTQQLLKTLRASCRQDALGTSLLTILSWTSSWRTRSETLKMDVVLADLQRSACAHEMQCAHAN